MAAKDFNSFVEKDPFDSIGSPTQVNLVPNQLNFIDLLTKSSNTLPTILNHSIPNTILGLDKKKGSFIIHTSWIVILNFVAHLFTSQMTPLPVDTKKEGIG